MADPSPELRRFAEAVASHQTPEEAERSRIVQGAILLWFLERAGALDRIRIITSDLDGTSSSCHGPVG